MRIRRMSMEGEVAALTARLAGDRAFVHPDFAALWSCKGGRPVAWILEESGTPAAVLPAVEFGRRPLVRMQSMPDGGYGGLLWNPDAAPDRRPALGRTLLAAVRDHGYARVHISDFYGSLTCADGFDARTFRTTLVTVPGSQWEPPCRKLVSQARKAEREGIEVEAMDWDRHGASFWRLVRHTDRRHGRRRPFYPREFYRGLAELSERWSGLHWVVCRRDGRMACSHIYLMEDDVLQGWQILFDKAFSFLKPNQYIRLRTCREFAARGIHRLNLGGTPENAAGLESYKKRWGGRATEYATWVRYGGLGRLLRRGAERRRGDRPDLDASLRG